MKKKIESKKGPQSVGPYSPGIIANNIIFLSGQLGMDTDGNIVSDDIVEQTQYVFKNIGILLNEVGLDYSHIVKTTVYLTDMNDFSKVNEEYEKYFEKIYPARSCIEISRLPKGGKVEIECIACY